MKKIYLVLGIMFIMVLVACGIKNIEPDKTLEAEDINIKVEDKKGEDINTSDTNNSDEEKEKDNYKLYTAYRATYDSCVSYTSESLEDQLSKEVRDLKIVAAGFVSLPDDYAEDYKSWRIENYGTGFKQAEVAESDGSTDEENNAEIEQMLAEAWASLDGYDEERAGIEVVAGATEENIKENQYTDNDGGYDEGQDYNPSAAEDYTVDPDLAARLAELGGVSGPTEKHDPFAGMTEEQIQQMLEDSQNTEFRIHGT